MTKWYVYIIENKLTHYYTGICKDMDKRFAEHQSNSAKCAKALRGKGPLTLKFCAEVSGHSEALKTEIWIKKLSKPNKVKLVTNDLAQAPIRNMLFDKLGLPQ